MNFLCALFRSFLLLISLLVVVPHSSGGNAGISVVLVEHGDHLITLVINYSNEPRFVNSRLLVGDVRSGADVEFIFTRLSDGKVFPLTARVQVWPLGDSSEYSLQPLRSFGRSLEICRLASMYSLDSGVYTVSAGYSPDLRYRPAEKEVSVISNAVQVEIDLGRCG